MTSFFGGSGTGLGTIWDKIWDPFWSKKWSGGKSVRFQESCFYLSKNCVFEVLRAPDVQKSESGSDRNFDVVIWVLCWCHLSDRCFQRFLERF